MTNAQVPWKLARQTYSLSLIDLQIETAQALFSFDYTIYQVRAGSVELSLGANTKPQIVRSPGLIFIEPLKNYTIINANADMLDIQIKREYLLEIATQLGLDWYTNEIFFLNSSTSKASLLNQHNERLIAEATTNLAGQVMALDAIVLEIVIELLRHWLGVRRNPSLELSRVGLVDRRLRRALEYIHTNYSQELALADIAEAAFLSEYHFAHLFKKITGLTPHNYLAAVRIEQAKQLIGQTDLSMATISADVGYASQSHFIKIFRSFTGTTPAKYREILKIG